LPLNKGHSLHALGQEMVGPLHESCNLSKIILKLKKGCVTHSECPCKCISLCKCILLEPQAGSQNKHSQKTQDCEPGGKNSCNCKLLRIIVWSSLDLQLSRLLHLALRRLNTGSVWRSWIRIWSYWVWRRRLNTGSVWRSWIRIWSYWVWRRRLSTGSVWRSWIRIWSYWVWRPRTTLESYWNLEFVGIGHFKKVLKALSSGIYELVSGPRYFVVVIGMTWVWRSVIGSKSPAFGSWCSMNMSLFFLFIIALLISICTHSLFLIIPSIWWTIYLWMIYGVCTSQLDWELD
jgi:hypothetical protein